MFAVRRFFMCFGLHSFVFLVLETGVYCVAVFSAYVSTALVRKLGPYFGRSGVGITCSVGTAFLDRSFETLFRSYTFFGALK